MSGHHGTTKQRTSMCKGPVMVGNMVHLRKRSAESEKKDQSRPGRALFKVPRVMGRENSDTIQYIPPAIATSGLLNINQ